MQKKTTHNNIKIAIVSSVGGHLEEVRRLNNIYGKFDHIFILNAPCSIYDDMVGRTFWITHSERDFYFFANLYQAWRIIRSERPTLFLSTGAGCIVPFALLGKVMGIPTIFIESLTRVHAPSLTGRIMRYVAAKTFYQWPQLQPYFPHGTYGRMW